MKRLEASSTCKNTMYVIHWSVLLYPVFSLIFPACLCCIVLPSCFHCQIACIPPQKTMKLGGDLESWKQKHCASVLLARVRRMISLSAASLFTGFCAPGCDCRHRLTCQSVNTLGDDWSTPGPCLSQVWTSGLVLFAGWELQHCSGWPGLLVTLCARGLWLGASHSGGQKLRWVWEKRKGKEKVPTSKKSEAPKPTIQHCHLVLNSGRDEHNPFGFKEQLGTFNTLEQKNGPRRGGEKGEHIGLFGLPE